MTPNGSTQSVASKVARVPLQRLLGDVMRWSSDLTSSVIDGLRHILGLVIRSFGNKDTERIWHEQYVKRMDRSMQRATLRKLELIHAAKDVEDLRIPPGNRLEQVSGDRRGQHSIRVNAQWRLCFVWREEGAEDVELVDYH